MWRNRLMMMMLAALMLWWAAQAVPVALAFKSATVKFAGTAQVAATNALIYCTPPTFDKIPRNVVTTGQLTCWNNTSADITVNVPAGTLAPTSAFVRWGAANPGTTSTTIAVPKGGSGTATMRILPFGAAGTKYTYTFTTAVTAPTPVEYNKIHKVTFTGQ